MTLTSNRWLNFPHSRLSLAQPESMRMPLRGGRSALKGTHEAPRVPFKLPSLPPPPQGFAHLPCDDTGRRKGDGL